MEGEPPAGPLWCGRDGARPSNPIAGEGEAPAEPCEIPPT
ncbi:hypothetical protein HRbin16_01114 [bacterium HR16]|nr:hypothetical protein HRbin16_01114 [bacterium HR16]